MAIINSKKIDGVKAMLRQCFPNNDPVTKDYLRAKVDEDIITIADKEVFIVVEDGKYKITQKGKTYRDS